MKAMKLLAVSMFLFVIQSIIAQKPIYFYDQSLIYREGIDLFDHSKYVPAKEKFEQFIDQERDPQNALRVNSEYYVGMCALYLNHPDAEYLLEQFAMKHPESPWVQRAYFELGSVNYQKKSYRKTLEWFNRVDEKSLSTSDLIEFQYKRGHSRFETGDKANARQDFFEVKSKESEYKSAATYYYSHIAYEQNDLETALTGFKSLSQDPAFAPIVPYYITQIYYKQKKYDDLLNYAPAVLDSAESRATKRVPEIAQLLGDALFRKEKYAQAIPYLEKYHSGADAGTISREDHYQLGYCYYRTSQWDNAIIEFGACSGDKDELYQLATYNLGDCYLKTDKKEYARNAYAEAADIKANREIQEDAMFNYAKLSFELSYNPFHEAITAFEEYLEKYPDSPRRDEAYEFLLNVYIKTRNYEKALASLDKIKNKDNRTKEAYQLVAYNRAVELFQAEQYDKSDKFFDMVNTYPMNPLITSAARFWKAELTYRKGDYKTAIQRYNSFLNEQGSINSEFYSLANYGIGYCYFKLANEEDNSEQMTQLYQNANTAFRKYGDGGGSKDNARLNDCWLRIGDCFFVTKAYAQAIQYYDKVTNNDNGVRDYAMFQKAMSYGYDGQSDKKAWVLKNLLTDYKDSKFEVDAKYELASSYLLQERLPEAKTYYNDILQNHPNSVYVKRALTDLCLVYVKEGNEAKVRETWNTIYKQYPNDPILANAVAIVRSTLIDDAEFQSQIKGIKYVQVSNEDIENEVYMKAANPARSGDCDKGISKLEAYLQQYDPAFYAIEANFLLAECYEAKGDSTKALASYKFIISQPTSDYTEESLRSASTIEYNQSSFQDALTHYTELEQVAVQKSNIALAQVGMMYCHYQLKNESDLKSSATKVISNSLVKEEVRTLAYLWRGNASLAGGDNTQAMADYKEVLKRGGSSCAEAKYHIAEILYKNGDYKNAEKEIFQLIEKYSSYAEWKFKGFLLLSDVYVGMKDYFQARATLNTLIDNVTESWVVESARQKLAALDAAEKPKNNEGSGNPLEINLVPNNQ